MARDRKRYEALKEAAGDWWASTAPAESNRQSRHDGWPNLPFMAFDSTEDVEALERRIINETLDEWVDQSPGEIESALHRFERKRKAAGKHAEELYRNRMLESDVEHARTEFRNWFAWNWKMRAAQLLLQHVDLHGPSALKELAEKRPWSDQGSDNGRAPKSRSAQRTVAIGRALIEHKEKHGRLPRFNHGTNEGFLQWAGDKIGKASSTARRALVDTGCITPGREGSDGVELQQRIDRVMAYARENSFTKELER